MKLPKTFMLEKASNEKIEKLLIKGLDFKPTYASSDKIIFDNLSFKQLKELARLEEKIYELKISFEYKKVNHEIVFTSYSERSSGRGSLKLIQHHPRNHLVLEELVGSVGEMASESSGCNISYHVPQNDCSVVEYSKILSVAEFYPKQFSDPSKKLEQFFDKGELCMLDLPFLRKTRIHVEYRGLTEDEYAIYVT